jgi:hypothetical protein
MMRFVITHPGYGIYLGSCLGLGFWSKMDPAGQDSAVTFPSTAEAQEHADGWESKLEGLSFVAVEADKDGEWASRMACFKAGLEPWEDRGLPKFVAGDA